MNPQNTVHQTNPRLSMTYLRPYKTDLCTQPSLEWNELNSLNFSSMIASDDEDKEAILYPKFSLKTFNSY